MDNKTRRDQGMAYLSDQTIVEKQLNTKRAIRQYNECMPFEMEKGMKYLEKAGIVHKKTCILNHHFIVSMGIILKWGRIFMRMHIVQCLM